MNHCCDRFPNLNSRQLNDIFRFTKQRDTFFLSNIFTRKHIDSVYFLSKFKVNAIFLTLIIISFIIIPAVFQEKYRQDGQDRSVKSVLQL